MLAVSFSDLRVVGGATASNETVKTIPVDASTEVTVTYSAALNSSAVLGAAGNTNTATLSYGNNPQVPDTTGTSVAQTATVNTYGLTLVKVDQKKELDGDDSTRTLLSGAKFTIQAKTTDEGTNNGKYLQQNGTFGSTEYTFTTDANGVFSVSGLDAGTYVIHEVEAPGGYSPLASDLVLELSVEKNADGSPKTVTASLTGGEGDYVEATGLGTRAAYDSSTGIVTVTATNAKGSSLPLTGLPGITLVYVAGGAVLVVSLATLVRRRMKNQG